MRKEGRNKGRMRWREMAHKLKRKSQTVLFARGKIASIEHHKQPTKKLLRLTSKFNKIIACIQGQ
jgi:hypothetical protein